MSKADYEKMFNEAKEKIEKYPVGQIFLAKDPFENAFWKALERGDKHEYGRFFKHKIDFGKVSGVEFYGKAANNSTQYIKRR